MQRKAPLFAAASAVVLAAAIAGAEPERDVRSEPPTAKATSEARDADLRDAIEEGLRRDPRVGRVPVEVRVENGNVVLYGSVGDEDESERAEAIAREAGARNVENHLRVGERDRQLPIDAIQAPSVP